MKIALPLPLVFFGVFAAKGDTIYLSQYENGPEAVGEYNAATGAAIDPSFITGLAAATALALSGNTLYVANYGMGTSSGATIDGTVGAYNATTGAAINADLITGISGATGLAVIGNMLFVSDQTSSSSSSTFVAGTVGEYNATTGAVINADFITGLSSPERLALSGNTLFVVSGDVGPNAFTVGAYNATTGAPLYSFTAPDPTGLAVSGNTLFLANYVGGTVGEYNASTGAVINADFITGLSRPEGLAVLGNDLFVAEYGSGVGEYSATTGAAINADFITGLPDPWDLAVSAPAVVPEPKTWSMIAVALAVLLGVMLRRKRLTA
jgi:hypothetical protein